MEQKVIVVNGTKMGQQFVRRYTRRASQHAFDLNLEINAKNEMIDHKQIQVF